MEQGEDLIDEQPCDNNPDHGVNTEAEMDVDDNDPTAS